MRENDRSSDAGPDGQATASTSTPTLPGVPASQAAPRRHRSWGPEDGGQGFRITDVDQAYLVWLVRVRYATAPQMARRFGVSEWVVYHHMKKLRRAGLAVHTPIVGSPLGNPPLSGTVFAGGAYGIFRPTSAGCSFVNSPLRPPTFAPGSYWHTLGLAELTVDFELAGKQVLTEREVRGMDPDPGTGRVPYAVPVSSADQPGKPKEPFLHYPDLVLPQPDGRIVAVELELSRKWASRWRAILKAYSRLAVGSSPLVTQVLYYLPRNQVTIRNRLATTIRQTGADSLVFIRPFGVKEDIGDGQR